MDKDEIKAIGSFLGELNRYNHSIHDDGGGAVSKQQTNARLMSIRDKILKDSTTPVKPGVVESIPITDQASMGAFAPIDIGSIQKEIEETEKLLHKSDSKPQPQPQPQPQQNTENPNQMELELFKQATIDDLFYNQDMILTKLDKLDKKIEKLLHAK